MEKQFSYKSIIEGEYYPGIYILGIDKVFFDGMTFADFSIEEQAAFAHEYTHYLQDISTTKGLLYYYLKAQTFQLHISLFQRAKEKIELPINLEKCGVKNAFAKTELLSFYSGSNFTYQKGEPASYKIHKINDVHIYPEELFEEIFETDSDFIMKSSIKGVEIKYDDAKTFLFGNECICESMAYLVEKTSFGAEKREREFPYNACEMVCGHIYPEQLQYPIIIVALCELSLMFDNSGVMYVNLINKLKNHSVVLETLDAFRLFFEGYISEAQRLFQLASDEIVQVIDVLFPTTFPYMFSVNESVKAYLQAGNSIRKRDPLFISAILTETDPWATLTGYVDLLPMPMLVGSNKELRGENACLAMMPVPFAILSYFKYPGSGCPLYDYCVASGLNVVDNEICKLRPWEQCKKNVKCPMAIYMIGYNIDRKEYSYH